MGGGTQGRWDNILSWEGARAAQNLRRLGLCHVRETELEEKEEVCARSFNCLKISGVRFGALDVSSLLNGRDPRGIKWSCAAVLSPIAAQGGGFHPPLCPLPFSVLGLSVIPQIALCTLGAGSRYCLKPCVFLRCAAVHTQTGLAFARVAAGSMPR